MLKDLYFSIKNPQTWLLITWYSLLKRYRKTMIGPLWMLLSPVMFIFFLGALLVGLSNTATSIFIPHMTIGLVLWTLIGGYLSRSHSIYRRKQDFLLSGEIRHTDLFLMDNAELFLHFAHQIVLIVFVVLFYDVFSFSHFLYAIPGLMLVLFVGFNMSIIVAILGARFRDLGEIVNSINGIAFLATPIIWMPQSNGSTVPNSRAGILEAYMMFNPFYHFLEIVRAPLMGKQADPISWMFAGAMAVISLLVAMFFYRRLRHLCVFWV